MIVVTGAAGFVGFHVARRLIELGREVVGFDNFNAFYTSRLKRDRLASLAGRPGWRGVPDDPQGDRA